MTCRRLPLFFNLRMDPYERSEITSNSYWAWTLKKAFMVYGAQAIAAEFTNTFKEFPPRQKPQSFNLDRILEQMQHPAQTD